MGIFSKLFGCGPKVDLKELVEQGATIVDVRTAQEYGTGKVRGAVNIPLNQLQSRIGQIRRDRPVIVYCASGGRSSIAKSILRNNGFEAVYNAGGIAKFRRLLGQ